jgi:tetratricopeptide (TPR) repeat protein
MLETLLDHNLLIQHVPGRYRFHDLLRAHAVHLAEQDPDGPAAHARLLDFYIHTTRAADRLIEARRRPKTAGRLEIPEPTRTFPDRLQAIAWLRQERTNLLAAAQNPSDRARSTALIGALTTQLNLEGPYDLASRLHEGVVEYARAQGNRLLEANALLELAGIEDVMGIPERGEKRAELALEIYRTIGSPLGEANSFYRLAHLKYVLCQFDQALTLFEDALQAYRAVNDRHGIAYVLSFLGALAHLYSRNTLSHTYYAEAIPLMQEIDDAAGEATCLLVLGRLNHALGEFDAAIPTLERCVALFEESGQAHGLSNALQELGRQHLIRGEYDEASQFLDRALALQIKIGFRIGEGNVYWERGRIAYARGDLDTSFELYKRALRILEAIGNTLNQAMALDEIARIQHAQGDHADARASLDRARTIYDEMGYGVGQAEVCNTRAALTADLEGAEAGLAAYIEALGLAERAEHPLERAHALEGIGRCELRLGQREAGLERLRAAVELYGRMHAREYGVAAAFLAEAEGAGAAEAGAAAEE